MTDICSDEVLTLAANHGDFLQKMRQTVEKYLEHNGRRWVDMSSLFSFMKR
jgi:DNA polymerase alpha subunit A